MDEQKPSQVKPVADGSSGAGSEAGTVQEELKVTGENLLKTIRGVMHEGKGISRVRQRRRLRRPVGL